MTNNFDPNQKRGGPANAGNWTAYENSNPEGKLPKADDRVTLAVGTGDYLNDGPQDGAIGGLYVLRLWDAHGTEQYDMTAEQQVDYGMFVPDGLDGDSAAAWSKKHQSAITSFLEERFAIHMNEDDTEGEKKMFAFATIEHTGPLGASQAFDEVWNGTDLVALYNESDSGTFGTENLDRLVREHLETRSVTGVPLHEARDISRREIDMSVELRAGEREISDRIAAAISYSLCDDGAARGLGHESAFDKLSRRGSVDKTELNDALRAEYAKARSPREKARLDMMFTWNQHGGDNS